MLAFVASAFTKVRSGPSSGTARGHGLNRERFAGKSLPAIPVTRNPALSSSYQRSAFNSPNWKTSMKSTPPRARSSGSVECFMLPSKWA